jgi:hypothetical protein
MVISAFVQPEGNPPWYARISFYDDASRPAATAPVQTSVEGVCDAVKHWLESVTDDDADSDDDSDDGSVTAS